MTTTTTATTATATATRNGNGTILSSGIPGTAWPMAWHETQPGAAAQTGPPDHVLRVL